MDLKREMFRHTLATLAYRAAKPLRGAPDGFADFRAAGTSRSAGEILAHMGDLLDWALSIVRGNETWRDSRPVAWEDEVRRFFAGVAELDAALSAETPSDVDLERLFQGPVADALTHLGQISMLRRLAGAPVKGENYHRAHISADRVGQEQAAAVREFD